MWIFLFFFFVIIVDGKEKGRRRWLPLAVLSTHVMMSFLHFFTRRTDTTKTDGMKCAIYLYIVASSPLIPRNDYFAFAFVWWWCWSILFDSVVLLAGRVRIMCICKYICRTVVHVHRTWYVHSNDNHFMAFSCLYWNHFGNFTTNLCACVRMSIYKRKPSNRCDCTMYNVLEHTTNVHHLWYIYIFQFPIAFSISRHRYNSPV